MFCVTAAFDLLHPGHIQHLKEARSFGDELIVALTVDEFVGKKGRPILDLESRAMMLMELKCVTNVSACRNAVDAILYWKPAVFVKGSDYMVKGLLPDEIAVCEQLGVQIRFTKPYSPTTSELIERIKNG